MRASDLYDKGQPGYLLGELHGPVVGDGDLEAVLTGVAAARDAAVGDARHCGRHAGHEVQLGEVHRGGQLAGHVNGALALRKRLDRKEKGK